MTAGGGEIAGQAPLPLPSHSLHSCPPAPSHSPSVLLAAPTRPPTTPPGLERFTVNFTITNLPYDSDLQIPHSAKLNTTQRVMTTLVRNPQRCQGRKESLPLALESIQGRKQGAHQKPFSLPAQPPSEGHQHWPQFPWMCNDSLQVGLATQGPLSGASTRAPTTLLLCHHQDLLPALILPHDLIPWSLPSPPAPNPRVMVLTKERVHSPLLPTASGKKAILSVEAGVERSPSLAPSGNTEHAFTETHTFRSRKACPPCSTEVPKPGAQAWLSVFQVREARRQHRRGPRLQLQEGALQP